MAAGLLAAAVAVAAFAFGPRVHVDERWREPALPADLDVWLAQNEAGVPGIRPGDAKGIVWAHPSRHDVTPLAILYLHGFSADRHEVEPLISDLGRELEANVFFTRLRGHGRDSAAMAQATVADWFDDTAEAVAVGGAIGERVVLVGTSTGGTMALWAAMRQETRGRIAALVLISPNLGLRDRRAPMLLWPWGERLARLIVGPEYCFTPKNPEQARHWTTCYPTRSLLPMMALVDHVRSAEAGALTIPALVLYSSRDTIVDPAVTAQHIRRLSGDGAQFFPVDQSTDPAQHVIAGAITSPETTDAVLRRILTFLTGV